LATDVPLAALCSTVILLVSICQQTMAQNSSPAPRRDINAVLAAHDKQLLAIPGVVGVYVATLEDRRTPCLKVMLAKDTPELRSAIPPTIEGYPVSVEVTGEIRALGKP
jgi:hypothetical protein